MANKKSTDLTKAYKYANVKLINYIQNTHFTSIEEMRTKINQAVNITAVNLQKDTAKHIKEGVFEASKSNGGRENQSVAEKKATHILEALTYASTANSIYRYSYLELGKHLRGISDNVAESINETLRELAKTGDDTIPNAKKIIVEKFERDGVLTVEYANGHKTNAENYAKMVARTSRMESTNLSNIKDALQLGTDIVECIGNDNTCSVCAKYRGRWFSISGKNPDYPPLYKTALSKGYNVIHPNCRCEFIGVYLEFHSDEEIIKQKELAKQPFKDDRTAAQKRGYDRWQATNRKLWSEQKEYEDMKAVFGEDFPYTTLGGFRRAKRAGTEKYKSIKKDFRTKKSYNKIEDEKPLVKVFDENNYKTFSSGKEVNDFFYYDTDEQGTHAKENSAHGKWLESLSIEQKAAINSYSQLEYIPINNYWRKEGDWLSVDVKSVMKMTKAIDEAIGAYELKTPIKVYRAVSPDLFKEHLKNIQELEGEDYSDKAFMSTSPTMESSVLESDFTMEIYVPAGKGVGAYINELSVFENEEYEFLLARDSKFKIIKAEKKNNKYYIKMEMIENG